MVRPTRVCVTILSAFALPLLAVPVLLRTSARGVGVFVSLASFPKCKGMHEYVRRLPFSPFAREVMFVLVRDAL